MKTFLTWIIISAVAALSSPAMARDGAFFLKACDAAVRQADGAQLALEEGISALHCSAYISGFREALALSVKVAKGPKLYCLPEAAIKNEELTRIWVKFLRENPDSLTQSGELSLYIALSKAYPCKIP